MRSKQTPQKARTVFQWQWINPEREPKQSPELIAFLRQNFSSEAYLAFKKFAYENGKYSTHEEKNCIEDITKIPLIGAKLVTVPKEIQWNHSDPDNLLGYYFISKPDAKMTRVEHNQARGMKYIAEIRGVSAWAIYRYYLATNLCFNLGKQLEDIKEDEVPTHFTLDTTFTRNIFLSSLPTYDIEKWKYHNYLFTKEFNPNDNQAKHGNVFHLTLLRK